MPAGRGNSDPVIARTTDSVSLLDLEVDHSGGLDLCRVSSHGFNPSRQLHRFIQKL